MALVRAVKDRTKTVADINGRRGVTLSVNIFEAMCQDTLQGNMDNADAGFEMMSEPYDRDPIEGMDNNLHQEWKSGPGDEGSNLGIVDCRPPLPQVWSNLYLAWNMAF